MFYHGLESRPEAIEFKIFGIFSKPDLEMPPSLFRSDYLFCRNWALGIKILYMLFRMSTKIIIGILINENIVDFRCSFRP